MGGRQANEIKVPEGRTAGQESDKRSDFIWWDSRVWIERSDIPQTSCRGDHLNGPSGVRNEPLRKIRATLKDGTPAAAHPTSCMSPIPDRKSGTAYNRPGRRTVSIQVRLALEQPQSLQLDQLIQGFRSGVTRCPIALLQPEPPAERYTAPDNRLRFWSHGFWLRNRGLVVYTNFVRRSS
jgi:hypothetical protein